MTKKATIIIEVNDENMITTAFSGNMDLANTLLAFSMITTKLLRGEYKQDNSGIVSHFKAESLSDRMNRK